VDLSCWIGVRMNYLLTGCYGAARNRAQRLILKVRPGYYLTELERSRLFDRKWFLERYKEVEEAGIEPELFFLRYAVSKLLDPNPYFDTRWYFKKHPDVMSAGINPLIHFMCRGWKEGRDPHPTFSVSGYLELHEDVARAGVNPLEHYLRYGQGEGRAVVPVLGVARHEMYGADTEKLCHQLEQLLGRMKFPEADSLLEPLPKGILLNEFIEKLDRVEELDPAQARIFRGRLASSLLRPLYSNLNSKEVPSEIGAPIPSLGYIASSPMPTRAANNVHVMKMCSALVKAGVSVQLFFLDERQGEQNYTGLFNDFGIEDGFPFTPVLSKNGFRGHLTLAYKTALAGCSRILTRSLIAGYFTTLFERPTILELHKPLHDHEYAMARECFRAPSFVKLIVITAALKGWYEAKFPELKGRIAVLPDAADPLEGEADFELANGGEASLHVGYSGQLYKGRGLELIVELAHDMPQLMFHIVGGQEKDIEYWRSETQDCSNVVFYGHIPHSKIGSFLQSVDVLVAPYQKEVFVHGNQRNTVQWMSPLKVFEYMASGKAMIVSDLPVIHEVLQSGDNAFLCGPDDHKEWQSALLKLAEDVGLRKRLGDRAKTEFLAKYTWKKRAQSISAILLNSQNSRTAPSHPATIDPEEFEADPPHTNSSLIWIHSDRHLDGAYGVNAARTSALMRRFSHFYSIAESKRNACFNVGIFFDLIAFQQWADEVMCRTRVLRIGGPSPMKNYSQGDQDRLRGVFGNFDAVIAVSPELASKVEQYHPHVHFIPNGLDLEQWAPDKRLTREKAKHFRVGMLAKLTSDMHKEQKGYFIAKEACALAGVDLLVAGRGFEEIPSDQIISEFYSQIDALIHPVGPEKEGCSNVIMESLALGVPVITTRYAGLHGSMLEDGKNALIPPRTPLDFALALSRLRDEPDLVSKLIERGREFAEKYHDIKVIASQYDFVLKEALANAEAINKTRESASPAVNLVSANGSAKSQNGAVNIDLISGETKSANIKMETLPLPTAFWLYGSTKVDSKKREDWAYGINARRLSSRIKSFEHVIGLPDEDRELDVEIKLSFDILIHEKKRSKKIRAKGTVVRIGGPNPLKQVGDGGLEALKEAFADVDAVIALSPQLKKQAEEFHGNVFFVPNGLELDRFHPEALSESAIQRPFRAGMAASLKTKDQREIKGYHIANSACAQAGVELMVVGRGVTQIPSDRMIEDFYSQIDVLIHPVGPGKEGSSNVIMECLALGVPVITTPYAGFHGEALQHGVNALVVDRYPLAIARALVAVKRDKGLRQELSVHGRKFAEKFHNIETIAKAYEQIFHLVCNKHTAPEYKPAEVMHG